MFLWNRPAPRYRAGQLVLRLDEENPGHKFMIIQNRRWIRPNDMRDKQWVYDGILIQGVGTEIVANTGISCAPESSLCLVTWHEHNRKLLDPRCQKKAA
ncbi:MAG TPA: hypothetical protein VHC20_01100 [Candidatus Paceibacterota bacterium]|nr:hypothetical protein [Candidatus Paceibacterota bacterium]